MRLKSLELSGYKTFATKTRFEFGERITAIVGPNGSGKSNIADALRWVLGEQAYSRLRAKKTEDMIFSGSEHRSRSGMASAEITFDNTTGWLAVDFAEVGITRRAYRDGQNDYMLNSQRVRLRDVTELLARAGISEQTYTIIGQGLVDRVLSLKPEERRLLLEDAAGIGLYRDRREESLKRLETTRRNLDRVQDILAELRPRLRSLERQARRWKEYDTVQTDLQVLLREWYGYHWHQAQRELAQARDIARQQDGELNTARKRHTELDEEMNTLRDRLQRQRLQLNAWHRELAQLHNRWETLNRDLAVSDERLRSQHERAARIEAELAQLGEELLLHQERFTAAQEEADSLDSQAAEARQQAASAKETLHQRQTERRQAEKALEETRHRLEGLNNRRIQLEVQRTEQETRLVQDQTSIENLRSALEQALQAVKVAQVETGEAAAAMTQAETARQQAEAALKIHREKVAAQQARQNTTQESRVKLQTVLARLQAQLEVLDQAEQSFTGYAEGARLLLEAAQKKRISGSYGALSTQLEVPAQYEAAIAAALGDAVDAILMDGANLDQALDLLAGVSARATLLPLAQLAPPEPPAPLDDPACLGSAAALVRAAPHLRPALDLLLGPVWIVQDRVAAQRLLARILPHQPGLAAAPRLVTLAGEVFHSEGQVVAGGRSSRPTLSRPRQRREILDAQKQTRSELAAIETEYATLVQDRQALHAQEVVLQTALDDRRRLEAAARSRHTSAGDTLSSAQRQASWQQNQFNALQESLKKGSVRLEELGDSRKQVEADLVEAQQTLRTQSQALAELGVEEYENQAQHWETQAAVAARTAEESRRRREDRRGALLAAQNRVSAAQSQRKALQDGQFQVTTNLEQMHLEKSALDQEIESLQTVIQPAEKEQQKLENDQERVGGVEGEALRALTVAERYHSQSQIALARRQEALESLRTRIEDDLGLVAFQYEAEVSGPTPLPLGELVEQLPVVTEISLEVEESIKRQRAQLRRMGPVNPEAQKEFVEVSERHDFIVEQVADLEKAEADIKQIIMELDVLMERNFQQTFDAVAKEFREIFTRLFGGGSARLFLTDPEHVNDSGVDIDARLPGRRPQELALLSGGERSLTATALVFSLLKVSGTPFCVLDEVDAMLDEANVNRFGDLLRELSQDTQFIVITHNRNTVQVADVIYGVTMGRDSTSQVLSLKLDEVDEKLKH